MRTFFTTEQELINILESPEEDIWKNIINKQKHIFVSLPPGREDWDDSNPVLKNFHRSGHEIYSYSKFFERIKNSPEDMTAISTPIFLLDISKEEAEKISRKYGVCCYSIGNKMKPFIAKRGWSIDTSDEDKPKTWDYFYDGFTPYCNSIIIIDRYLFACDYHKKNKEPDEYIQDSYDNLEKILTNVLPQESDCKKFVLTIIFSCSSNKGGIGEETPSFTEIIEEIQNIKTKINRPYEYDIEIISIDKGCAYYNDTHDRFVITNYSITEATHKIKAYREGGISLCKQKLSFDYTYSMGIEIGDKSSLPLTTQERIINSLKKYINNKKNREKIRYALNGEQYSLDDKEIQNKMIINKI